MDAVLLRRITIGVAFTGVLVAWLLHRSRSGGGNNPSLDAQQQALMNEFLALETAENDFVRREWPGELDAEKAEDQMFQYWDALNNEADVWALLGRLPFSTLQPAQLRSETHGEAGIQIQQFVAAAGPAWNSDAWREWLAARQQEGWKLEHSHWRLPSHTPGNAFKDSESRLELTAHLSRPERQERVRLAASLTVRWGLDNSADFFPKEVRVESLEVARRTGPSPFQPWLEADIPPPRHTVFVDPLICTDLDGDGFQDLLLVGAGRLWRNQLAGKQRGFAAEAFPGLPPERVFAAALIGGTKGGQRQLFLGGSGGLSVAALDGNGRLVGPPQIAWAAAQPLKHPQVLAVGDVDGDGDADVWLAQYKLPYQGGQFPTPWFDANDGFASHLLRNDGAGKYTDVTASSGLDAKAHRRTYSASFIDLDGDGDLDLVNVSDFAGTDVFLNDGKGHFNDATAGLSEARFAFGMAHAFADVNGDAHPDLLVLGMDSTVADRLNALGLDRALPGRGAAGVAQRAAMVYGNRLLASTPAGLRGLSEANGDAFRHTGWSWGCAWGDFNLDGRLDLAVANGHETFASTRDYERNFWQRDPYIAGSTNTPLSDLFFRNVAGRRRAEQISYGGWQANAFLLSGLTDNPHETAWLLGVAETADCRNLVAADFDNDGRLDLAFTTFEQWPMPRARLLVFHNELPVAGRNWIGVELAGEPADLGARVEIQTASRRFTQWLVLGDSFRSQGPFRLHFGLGAETPQRVEVFRANGSKAVLANPQVNAWQGAPR